MQGVRTPPGTCRMASVRCRCKKVSITFPTHAPGYSLECCCVDCFQKLEWSCEAGGIAMGRTHGTGKPLLLSYFANKMRVKGKQFIAFNKLRKGAASTNMVASCCGTLLVVDHPGYACRQVLMFPEFTPLADAKAVAPFCRVFVKDWQEKELAKLPKLPSEYVDHKSGEVRTSKAVLERFAREKAANGKTKDATKQGVTFQDLLQEKGGKVEILGLPEAKNSFRLRAVSQAPALKS